jgi:DNA-directed RNA polymerase subunit A'
MPPKPLKQVKKQVQITLNTITDNTSVSSSTQDTPEDTVMLHNTEVNQPKKSKSTKKTAVKTSSLTLTTSAEDTPKKLKRASKSVQKSLSKSVEQDDSNSTTNPSVVVPKLKLNSHGLYTTQGVVETNERTFQAPVQEQKEPKHIVPLNDMILYKKKTKPRTPTNFNNNILESLNNLRQQQQQQNQHHTKVPDLSNLSSLINRTVKSVDDIPEAEIDIIQFTFMSTEEILKWSVMEVTSQKLIGLNSVSDLRLGPSNMNEDCATCKNKWKICPGHFGHIMLPVKVPHALRMKNIVEFLSLFCYECYRLVVMTDKMKLCDIYSRKGEARFRAILQERMNTVSTCPHCDRNLPDFNFDDEYKFFGKLKNKTFPVPIPKIEEIFDNIPPCDIAELGLDSESVHPSKLLIGAVLVIPPCARSYVKNATGINHDDLDLKYQDIVKYVQAWHKAAVNTKAKSDAYDNICYHIRTLMDNSKGKVKSMGNKRSVKCIKKRLTSKSGLIRGHLQGKRVNFCARSVITPDSTLWVDELVVPECFAKTLSYPVHVNKHNINWCQHLLDTDKVNNIYRDDICYTASRKLYTRGFDLLENDIIVRKLSSNRIIQIHVYSYLYQYNKLPDLQIGDIVYRHNKVYTDVVPKQRKPFLLREGDIIDRQLIDGDWTLFNRQPTLWKGSMRAMRVKVMPGKTFRFNMACTAAYNADHDGDEVNIFFVCFY